MKQFTSILFGLVLVMGISVTASADPQSACVETACKSEKKSSPEQRNCEDKAIKAGGECAGFTTDADKRIDKKDAIQACTTAAKEYNEAVDKSFCKIPSEIDKCEDKINSCISNAQSAYGLNSGLGDITGIDGVDGAIENLFELYKAKKGPTTEPSKSFNPNTGCYNKIAADSKKKEEARKKKEELIKDLKKQIEEQKAKLRKSEADMKKDVAKNEKDQSELKEKLNETIQGIEKSKQEEAQKISKQILDASTKIRKTNNEIVKIKNLKETAHLKQQDTLLSYAQDKIDLYCKIAKKNARTCFLSASKKTAEALAAAACKDDSLKSVSGLLSDVKGTARTGTFKSLIKVVEANCYQEREIALKNEKNGHANAMRDLDLQIKEKNDEIQDENKQLDDSKKSFEELTKQFTTKKTDAESAHAEKLAIFSKELRDLQTGFSQEKADLEKIISDRDVSLQRLLNSKTVFDYGLEEDGTTYEDVSADAYAALERMREASNAAANACCEVDPKSKNCAKYRGKIDPDTQKRLKKRPGYDGKQK
ncbi:MAG: hypothetical protein H7Z71_04815 [Moraxellaceae bacterium]|nr:hypothetical protein [Pseudobdellovibrionaceae bacterium]